MSSNTKQLLNESDSDSEPEIYINREYAEKYENWRKKEEYQKLKSKYGDTVLSESSDFSGSDSETDSDQDLLDKQLNQEIFDEDFFRVYGALKSKDPRIYDETFTFVNNPGASTSTVAAEDGQKVEQKNKKAKQMHLLDYHMELMKKRGGVTEEDHDEPAAKGVSDDPSYYEKLGKIKEGFKQIIDQPDSDNDDDILTSSHGKASQSKEAECKSQSILENANDSDIAFLNEYWNREDVDDTEKFIRDYILKKKYLDKQLKVVSTSDRVIGSSKDDTVCFFGNMPQEDESIEDEEKKPLSTDETAKFRFQEQGGTQLARYPRVVDSARDLSSREDRSSKRKERRELKKKEKEEDLMRLTQLKRETERERIRKVMEASKNKKIHETDPKLEKLVDEVTEFDPDEYDSMMKKLYDNDYYKEGEEEDEKKPAFEFISGIDDASEESEDDPDEANGDQVDEEINPGDSDLDQDESEEVGHLNCRKRRRVRKKKLRERLRKAKDLDSIPDFEDVIGKDLPVRFKYRKVIPNDFGLSIEEILLADDKDLNRWASLKTTVAFRDESEEQHDLKRFNSKRNDIKHKKKILKSLFKEESAMEGGKKKKKRGKKKSNATVDEEKKGQEEEADPAEGESPKHDEQDNLTSQDEQESETPDKEPLARGRGEDSKIGNKKRGRKRKRIIPPKNKCGLDVDRLKAYGFSKTEMKKKKLL